MQKSPYSSDYGHNSLWLCAGLHGLLFLVSCKPRLKFFLSSWLSHGLFQRCEDTPSQFLSAKIGDRCSIDLSHRAFTVLICQKMLQVIIYRNCAQHSSGCIIITLPAAKLKKELPPMTKQDCEQFRRFYDMTEQAKSAQIEEEFAEFIRFCVERLKRGDQVQSIWNDFLEKAQ